MNTDHLSYSSISMYLDCPEAWRRKYIAGEPTRKTGALAFGSAIHNTIERIVQGGDVLGTWKEEFEKSYTEDVIFDEGDTREANYNEGVRLLTNTDIQNVIRSIVPYSPEHIEYKVELRVPGVPIPIIGYIDIILTDGTPADFKTSARSWTQDQANNSLQTLFYLAALNQMGWDINWRFRHYVFVKTKTPQVQILEHEHKPGELFFLFEMVRRVWEGISKEYFPLNPTTWRCSPKYCDFYANCRGRYAS